MRRSRCERSRMRPRFSADQVPGRCSARWRVRSKSSKPAEISTPETAEKADARCAITPCSSASRKNDSGSRISAAKAEIFAGSRGWEHASSSRGQSRARKSDAYCGTGCTHPLRTRCSVRDKMLALTCDKNTSAWTGAGEGVLSVMTGNKRLTRLFPGEFP